MSGETNLRRLLATLSPRLDPEPFGIVVSAHPLPSKPVFSVIHEAEGVTVIAKRSDLEACGMVGFESWARITLQVHSSLQAVGLTAAVSTALAELGISANMIAAFHHDHVFVPWDKRDAALACLSALSAGA
jgi:uncharacterized protein